jgi:hypothetical protein
LHSHVVFLRSLRRLLITAKEVTSSVILVTMMMGAIRSSETSGVKEPHGVISQNTKFFKKDKTLVIIIIIIIMLLHNNYTELNNG